MKAKHRNLRGFTVWFAGVALIYGALSGTSVAEQQGIAVQDKKEEKKDEKKDEKKVLPLKPDRKLEFTTDEGTWLSLDASPRWQDKCI